MFDRFRSVRRTWFWLAIAHLLTSFSLLRKHLRQRIQHVLRSLAS